jgi:hypothetical protein
MPPEPQTDAVAAAPAPIHPACQQVLQYFAYAHLPERLQAISKPVHDLAWQLVYVNPSSPETTVGLRKLLEAKDCFVRAGLS